MNKTTKFINKLIADTKNGLINWKFNPDLNITQFQAIINNETVAVIKNYDKYDGTAEWKIFIANRYTLNPDFYHLLELIECVFEFDRNRLKKPIPENIQIWINKIIN